MLTQYKSIDRRSNLIYVFRNVIGSSIPSRLCRFSIMRHGVSEVITDTTNVRYSFVKQFWIAGIIQILHLVNQGGSATKIVGFFARQETIGRNLMHVVRTVQRTKTLCIFTHTSVLHDIGVVNIFQFTSHSVRLHPSIVSCTAANIGERLKTAHENPCGSARYVSRNQRRTYIVGINFLDSRNIDTVNVNIVILERAVTMIRNLQYAIMERETLFGNFASRHLIRLTIITL